MIAYSTEPLQGVVKEIQERHHLEPAEYLRLVDSYLTNRPSVLAHYKSRMNMLHTSAFIRLGQFDDVARRIAIAEQKIAQAEREAVNEVRSSAVEIAVEAARKLLADSPEIKAGEELFKSSLQELKSKLN